MFLVRCDRRLSHLEWQPSRRHPGWAFAQVITRMSSDPARSFNGGDYTYGVTFYRHPNRRGTFAEYYCSAQTEFAFCRDCGMFGEHNHGPDDPLWGWPAPKVSYLIG